MSEEIQPDRRGLSEQKPPASLAEPSRPLFAPPIQLPHHPPTERASRLLAYISLWAYLGSFFLPVTSGNEWFGGFAAFFFSGLALVLSFGKLEMLDNHHFWLTIAPWLANPLFWYAQLQMFGRRPRRFVGGVAALAAALLASGYLFDSDVSPFGGHPRNGWFGNFDVLGPAYYVWLGSFVLLAAAGVVGSVRSRKTQLSDG